MAKSTILEEIVSASVREVERSGEAQLERVKLLMGDLVSVASAGFLSDPKPLQLYSLLARESGGPSTVFGLWTKTETLCAVIVNAFSAHTLELDDWLANSLMYVGASIVPAVLAFAERSGSTLLRAARAVMLGYEVAGRIGLLLGRRHYRHWHTSSTAGGGGVAAALVYLTEGASVEDIVKAVYAAMLYAAGLRTKIWKNLAVKPFSPAHAAFVGLSSLALKSFISRVDEIFSSSNGLCSLMDGECSVELALNPPWRYAVEVTLHKLFPVSRCAQTSVKAALELHGKVEPERVREVRLETFDEAYRLADIVYPLTVEEARFSLSFLVSACIARGWRGIYDLKSSLHDARVRELESKVRVEAREDFAAIYPERQPARVVVETVNGEVLESYEEKPLGSPSDPRLRSLIESKISMLSEISGDFVSRLFCKHLMSADPEATVVELIERAKRGT
ncbi:MAG: MmgE/PrpD family protein [Fervidicoccaceae archaeon]